MRCVALALAGALVITASSAIATDDANASTVYDGAYSTIDHLEVSQNQFYNSLTCAETDLTHAWVSYITDPKAQLVTGYNTEYAMLRESFLEAFESGSYAVSINLDTAPTTGQYMQTAVVYWTEDGDAELDWVSYGSPAKYGVDLSSAGGEIHFAQIGNKAAVVGSGGCEVGWGYPDTTNYPNISGFYNHLSTSTWANPPTGSYHASANLLSSNVTVNYPVGYEGLSVEETAPPAKYVAMGDSFSSGEGVEAFAFGSDIDGVNECHRSINAYPTYLINSQPLGADSMAHVACSGATTESLRNTGQWNEPAQIEALSSATEIVTLTIGGNDVGFKEFATSCLWPYFDISGLGECDEFTDIYDETMSAIQYTLPTNIENTLSDILFEAPNSEIYLVGYPYLAPDKATTDPDDSDCGELIDDAIYNKWGDARAAFDVVTALNLVLENAVDTINTSYSTSRIHFVDVTDGAFVGYDMCETVSYFNAVDPVNLEYTAHPNFAGQYAYYQDILEEINN